MSVSYEKLETKCKPDRPSDDEEKRSTSNGAAMKPFLAGLGLLVGGLMVAAVVVVIVSHHHYHQFLCGNASDTSITFTSTLVQLTRAFPSNSSCVCTRKINSDSNDEGSPLSDCYTFLGHIVMKGDMPWMKVESVDTTQVSWIPFLEAETVPQATCERIRSSKVVPEQSNKFSPGIVPQQCLECICLTESMCKPVGCHWDVSSDSCGYFQIKYNYWLDCGKPGSDWKSCADDMMCSSKCVQAYMKRYATHYKCPLTCEGFAREHNGGPKGCFNPATLPYWKKVQNHDGCHHLTKVAIP